MPPSINKQNPPVTTLPQNISHVYVKQHNIKGLASKYLGAFPITSRISNSQIEIKVGLNAQGQDRLEIRHISDLKAAYLRDDAEIAVRPRRGRPKKTPTADNPKAETKIKATDIDEDPPFKGFDINQINTTQQTTWSASNYELKAINDSVGPWKYDSFQGNLITVK